jgi:tRNA modification GTPase
MNIDTIVATATPPGRGGIAVVRISGPLVKPIAEIILKKTLIPRLATFSTFLDKNEVVIDEGLALFFPSPHSFTGEDVLELQGHGGLVIVDCLIRRIVSCGARLARPGEFSERAFLNDKLDLVQAEAIADLIDASSEQAARSALRSLQGDFSKKINFLVNNLIQLRMYVEAAIDFAEEEIDFLAEQHIVSDLDNILIELNKIENQAHQGSLLRDGIHVVIAGCPNVGKSSLINALSGKETAIVTDIPGTTRDVLREYILIDGMPLHIMDTAGLRESDNLVEKEGIRRAHHEIEKADLILYVVDEKEEILSEASSFIKKIPASTSVIVIRNKIDLTNEEPKIIIENEKTVISLSAKMNQGLDLLKNQIKSVVGFKTTNEGTFSARRRHLDALASANTFLLSGKEQLLQFKAGELLAEDLRQAQLALSEITGEFTSDDLLGKIFSSFCIGK